MRLIDADEVIEGRVKNDPVRIAVICAPTVIEEKIVRFLLGEWVECEIVEKVLGMTFKQCFAVFEFSRTAEWWSVVGKTEEERKREGQKITTYFRIKREERMVQGNDGKRSD